MNNKQEIDIKRVEYLEKRRLSRIANKEKIKEASKLYRLKNKDRLRESKRIYRENNQPIIKASRKRYKLYNSDKIKEGKRRFYLIHKEDINNYAKTYNKNRRVNDPIFKMVTNIRSRIYVALKGQSTYKSLKTLDLLGASKEDVWNHIESLFKEGMTRENHAPKGWHIDHIIPCASFDLSDPEQQKKCFHYTNLQPLWWWENLEKSDKPNYDLKNSP